MARAPVLDGVLRPYDASLPPNRSLLPVPETPGKGIYDGSFW